MKPLAKPTLIEYLRFHDANLASVQDELLKFSTKTVVQEGLQAVRHEVADLNEKVQPV